MYHENSPVFHESCDTWWLKNNFEFKEISHIFKTQHFKPLIKHVTSKFIEQKQQFFLRDLKYFWKLSLLMFSRYLRKRSRTNWVQKNFIEAFKYQKYKKFILNYPKMTVSNFCCISRKTLEQKLLKFRALATKNWSPDTFLSLTFTSYRKNYSRLELPERRKD